MASEADNRPVAEWLADLFAVVDAERRKLCSAASGEGGDPPCWSCLPDAYRSEECSAGCGTRAILAALTAAEPFFEPGTTLNECIAELGDDEPFVVQRGPDGWEVRKMTAWKVLNQEVFAEVRKEAIEEAAKVALDEELGRRLNFACDEPDADLRWVQVEIAAAIRALSDPPVLDEVVGTGEEQGNEWDDLR